MNYLVGDIGNTLIKFSVLDKKYIIKNSYIIETKKIFNDKIKRSFLKKFLNEDISKNVVFSSVVPKAFNILKRYLLQKKLKVFEIKDLNVKKLLSIKVNNYNQLGSDRIANAVGSLKYKNCLIIDFGTATTFDILKNYVYIGGVISPGIKLSISNLNKSTALLPLINLKKKQKSFGKNTAEALNAGFLWGYEGLINNIIKKIILKTKVNYKIILTGGYAKLFSKYINKKNIIDQNITIKGVARIFKELI